MESRTDEFLRALKEGRLYPLDIDNGINELTGGIDASKLNALLDYIMEDISRSLFQESYNTLDDFLELERYVKGNESQTGFNVFWNLRSDPRIRAVRMIMDKLHIHPNVSKIFRRRILPEGVQEDSFRVFMTFIQNDRQEDLKRLLSGEAVPSKPLLFDGNWTKLGHTFGYLYDNDFLQGFKNKEKELAGWLMKNFQTSRNVKPDSIKQYLSDTPYKMSILRIDPKTGKLTKS